VAGQIISQTTKKPPLPKKD
jgi:hypothetical protein